MNEDKTSTNDELEANENDDAHFTETEEATEETSEQAQSSDSEGGDSITLSRAELEEREREIRKEQDRRWKDRIKGLEGKEGREESGQESREKSQEGVASKEELDRFRLETKGVENKAQQDFVLKYAKLEGLSVSEALNDDIVKAKLERMNADGERSRATQSPINRTGKPREKTGDELARDLETKGVLPKTPAQRKAALQALQNKYGRT